MLESQETIKSLNRKDLKLEPTASIKIVQFGEGNFLRAFVDYAFQELNKSTDFRGGVAVVQPIETGMVHLLNAQDGLYTLFMKGIKNGTEIQKIELISNIVKSVNPYTQFQDYLKLAREEGLEFIISNTTEAGISYEPTDNMDLEPPVAFPAKLTVFLYERFKHFKGDSKKGLTIIPCELINYNADTLKEIILKYTDQWGLGTAFRNWITTHNSFHNTLVDRIVPGYPKAEIDSYNAALSYIDQLIVTAEDFFLWVIEGDQALKDKLPFQKTTLDVKIVSDLQPYRTRKVRILNGAHTAMVPFALLYGHTTVKETVDHEFTGPFIQRAIFEEIIPTLELTKEELIAFANEVLDRFRNPFIVHNLSSIALNSISKFKVRVLPSLLGYISTQNSLPVHLTYAFACLLRFYKGAYKGQELPVQDSDEIVATFKTLWARAETLEVAKAALNLEEFWGTNLNRIPNLTAAIAIGLDALETHGVEKGFHLFQQNINTL
ncbi:MAG: altronate oxidoreductase [Bacteroidota bacterium]|jgi:tagaturonate reductase